MLWSRLIRRSCLIPALSLGLVSAAIDAPRKQAGKYEVSLRLPADGLHAQEEMEIEFRVVDTSAIDPIMGATAVVRARIQGTIDMPSMPGMPKFEDTAHPEGVPGEYGLHPTFAHGGDYLLRLDIEPPGGQRFTIDFPLAVQDAKPSSKGKPRPQPFRLDLMATPKNPKAGAPAELEFRVRERDKPKEIFSAFEVVHEKRMHLLIVRDDLSYFAHEHPEPAPDGIFRLRYAFPVAGDYHIFADVAPRGAGSQVLLAKLRVQGKSGSRFDVKRASAAEKSLVKKVEGVEVELKIPHSGLPARKTTGITFHLKDAATGRAITDLQPYLGAMGHLILIHQDGVTFVHSHPDERQPGAGRDGAVPFLVRFPKAGVYRGWSQFQRNGNILTGDFILEAAEAANE